MEYQIKIDDIKDDVLEGQRRPVQVSKVVSYILEQNGADGSVDDEGTPRTMSTLEIIDAYKKLLGEDNKVINIPENSISTLLSLLAKSEDYPIYCQGRKQGYFYKPISHSEAGSLDEEQANEAQEEHVEGGITEKDMYPHLVAWFQTKGYEITQEISTKKRKGQWRNPDILGIKTLDVFKTTYIEIATIEAKLSKSAWTKDIFEAISHTVFSNKSYFAYLCNESEKIDEEMIYYAQKFNIGILQVMIPNEKWGKPLIDCRPEEVDIQEVFPAPDQKPSLILQKRFLKNIGINDFDDYKLLLNGNLQK